MYVGCTSRKLKVQISEHSSYITKNATHASGAAPNFIEKHGSTLDDFSFFALEKAHKLRSGGDWH